MASMDLCFSTRDLVFFDIEEQVGSQLPIELREGVLGVYVLLSYKHYAGQSR